jgi:SAM-dependent methyltransferase
MSLTDPERLERERLEADRRYNDSLTALDHAVAGVTSQWTTAHDDLGRLSNALIMFLQQITAFVETKDRQLAADAARRIDALAPSLEIVGELRTQVAVIQRALETLKRTGGSPESSEGRSSAASAAQASATHHPSSAGSADDYKYVGFEDQFRGADADVEKGVRAYLPIFEGRSNVLDIGCGRGELLSALRDAGVSARGIDTNAAMVAVAHGRGLDACAADALACLSALPDASLGGIAATQVIEHFEPSYLMRLLDQAARTLRPGSPIVLETINPACWLAFFSSYIRDLTHVRPIHPETLQYLLRAGGFERVAIRYSAPVPDHMKMKTVDLPADVLRAADPAAQALTRIAHSLNANAVILNNLMFSHLDYAAIGYRI